MGLFSRNSNEEAFAGGKKNWTDVIKNSGPGELLIWRQPEEDFNTNSTLIVMPGEQAIFIKNGKIEQVFENGSYKLSTENYPFISRIRNAFSGGISTFNCVVYFVRQAHSEEIMWGTSDPLKVNDPTYDIYLNIRSYGAFKIKISNCAKFLEKMIGNNINMVFQMEVVSKYFGMRMQQYIKSCFSRAIKKSRQDVIDVINEPDILAEYIAPFIQEMLDEYGIRLVNFSIASISVADDDQGYQTIMEMKMNMAQARIYGDNWARFQSKDIMKDLANNPGAGGVAAAGAGMGMGLAAGGAFGAMSQQMFSPMQQASAPVQPPPTSGGRFVQQGNSDSGAAAAASKSPIELIKQLKEMLDLGVLSQEEFDAKKQEILNRM